jgi:hypothetical protein
MGWRNSLAGYVCFDSMTAAGLDVTGLVLFDLNGEDWP